MNAGTIVARSAIAIRETPKGSKQSLRVGCAVCALALGAARFQPDDTETSTMTDPLVIRSDRSGLTTLTLNRPDKLNALTPAFRPFVA